MKRDKCLTHQELRAKCLADPKARAEYDALEEEFALLNELIATRKNANLSQAQVAKRMGISLSALVRMQGSLGSERGSPSFRTLCNYAAAVGCKVHVRFIKQ